MLFIIAKKRLNNQFSLPLLPHSPFIIAVPAYCILTSPCPSGISTAIAFKIAVKENNMVLKINQIAVSNADMIFLLS